MKILYLTGGAGRMYCGSCLRDNALATELIARGHDVLLLPVYTPTLTDEPNASYNRVFLGGISVYLEQYVSLFRKTPRWLDRIWDSRLMLQLATRASLSTDPRMLGEMTVSMLRGADGFQRKEIEKLVEWTKHEPPPDIISLPYTLLLGLAEPLRNALQCPISCTLQGEELFLEGLQEPYHTQALDLIREQTRFVDRFIAVSEYCAEFMSNYLGIASEKISVVPLGINLSGFGPRSNELAKFTVGYFARVAPEKGLHVLAEAFKLMRSQIDTRLEVAGYLAPEHKPYLDQITQKVNDWGLGHDFQYRGILDREQKISFLQGLDVLSVPATYDEPKGMFLLEAMACGVPVVQPGRGGFTEIVERTGGGLLVEPDNPEALAAGIIKLAKDRDLARQLSDNGIQGVRNHYSVSHMADRALEAYESVSAKVFQLS